MSLKKRIKKVSLKTFDVRKHLTPKYLSWMNDKSLLKYSEQRHYKNTRTNCLNYFKEIDPEILDRVNHISKIGLHKKMSRASRIIKISEDGTIKILRS